MNHLTDLLVRIGILKKDLDYYLIRASMVITFLFFGVLLFLGFWNKKMGILGALGARFSFIATFTIIPLDAGWLGCICGGLPCYDRESCVSYEGSRSVRGVVLSTETGRRKSRAVEGLGF